MVKYVSYWDCSNWNSEVEVMNPQDRRADYRITVYDRDGSVKWSDNRSLTPHETERLAPCKNISGGGKKEGLVVVEPGEEEKGDAEFPSLLTICDAGRHWKEGNRFVPFTRVP